MTINENGTFWQRCFREYVWTDENGAFRKRWGHTINSNPLRAILETYSRWGRALPFLVFRHVCVKHAQSGKLLFSNRFIVYVWTDQNEAKCYEWTRSFWKTEKKSCVFKRIRIRMDRALVWMNENGGFLIRRFQTSYRAYSVCDRWFPLF